MALPETRPNLPQMIHLDCQCPSCSARRSRDIRLQRPHVRDNLDFRCGHLPTNGLGQDISMPPAADRESERRIGPRHILVTQPEATAAHAVKPAVNARGLGLDHCANNNAMDINRRACRACRSMPANTPRVEVEIPLYGSSRRGHRRRPRFRPLGRPQFAAELLVQI